MARNIKIKPEEDWLILKQSATKKANRRLKVNQGLYKHHSAIAAPSKGLQTWFGLGSLSVMQASLRFVIALLLLPLAWIFMEALFRHMASLSWIDSQIWLNPSVFYFTAGVIIAGTWFFPRVLEGCFLWLYVLGHELTHLIVAWTFYGAKIKDFKVTRKGGYVVMDKSNIIIALSPYFVPFWSLIVGVVWWLIMLVIDWEFEEAIGYGLMGMTSVFHLLWTLRILPLEQPDIKENGSFFSLILIFILNLVILITWFSFIFDSFNLLDYANYWRSTCILRFETLNSWLSL